MRGIHTQIDALTNHLIKNVTQDQLRNSDAFNMIFQKMIFQSLKLVNIIFDQTLNDSNIKGSFQKFVKQLKLFVKKRPDQEQSDDQFFDKQYDEVSCFLNNRKPVITTDQVQRGDIYKFLSQAESKQKDMKQFIQNSAKFASQKKLNRLLQSSKKLRDILMVQKQAQTELQFQQMNKLSTQIQKVQKLKIKERQNHQQQATSQKVENQNNSEDNHPNKSNQVEGQHQTIVKFQISEQENFKSALKIKTNQKQLLKQVQNISNKKAGVKKPILKGRNSMQNANQIKKVVISQFKDKVPKLKENLQNQNQKSSIDNENSLNNKGIKKSRKVISEGDEIQNSLLDFRPNGLKNKQNQISQNKNLSQADLINLDSLKESNGIQKTKKFNELKDIEVQTQIAYFNKQQLQKVIKEEVQNAIKKQTMKVRQLNAQNQTNKQQKTISQKQSYIINFHQSSKTQNVQNEDICPLKQNKQKINSIKTVDQNNINLAKDNFACNQQKTTKLQQLNKNLNYNDNYLKNKSLNSKLKKENSQNQQKKSKIQQKLIKKNDNVKQSKNKISLPHIKKQSNFSSFHTQHDKSLNFDVLKSIQNNSITMPKLSNKSNQLNISRQDNKIIKQLQKFVKQNSVKANIKTILMYVQFFQTMHVRQCGQNCIHLNKFYQFLKKRNIPARKELMMHKTDITKTFQF